LLLFCEQINKIYRFLFAIRYDLDFLLGGFPLPPSPIRFLPGIRIPVFILEWYYIEHACGTDLNFITKSEQDRLLA